MRLRLLSAAMLLFVSAAARADSVIFTLTNPVQSVTAAGGTLSFNATASAPASNTGAEDLTGLFIQINPTNQFTADASNFFVNWPLSLAPGDTYSDLLFTLSVPANATPGRFLGSVELDGGPNGTALSTQNFTVNVTPAAVAATPEPSSLLMLGTGALALAGSFRRRLS